MLLSNCLTDTAYGYSNLSAAVYVKSAKVSEICTKISDLRHEIAQGIYTENINDVTLGMFDHVKEKDDFDAYIQRVVDNDNKIYNRLLSYNDGMYKETAIYVREHIYSTMLLVESFVDLFIDKNTLKIYSDVYICSVCGRIYSTRYDFACDRCETDASRIIPINYL